MSHTLTPWRIASETGPCVIAGRTREVCECYEDGETQIAEDEANAAHIVKCVNAHDELVAFVLAVGDYCEDSPMGDRARDLLAKVSA